MARISVLCAMCLYASLVPSVDSGLVLQVVVIDSSEASEFGFAWLANSKPKCSKQFLCPLFAWAHCTYILTACQQLGLQSGSHPLTWSPGCATNSQEKVLSKGLHMLTEQRCAVFQSAHPIPFLDLSSVGCWQPHACF